MKRIAKTLVLVLCLLTAGSASAQINFGITGGVNLTKVSFNKMPSFDSNNRAGWYIGPKVECTIPIIGLGIDAAVEYSQRRVNINEDNTNASSSNFYKSIEIPISLRYQFGLESLAAIYVHTGPQFGFNVGDKNWKTSYSEITSFEWKKSNVSWNFGAGVKLLKHLEAGINYNVALSKYAKVLKVGDTESSIKANGWQFQVAYIF